MNGIRRFGLMLGILTIGAFIGLLGLKNIFLILAPLFLLWFILWDDKSYHRNVNRKPTQHTYVYKR